MKHLHTFSQHINESNTEPVELDLDDWMTISRDIDRVNLSTDDKEKLRVLKEMSGYQEETWNKSTVIARKITDYEHVSPRAFFIKSKYGDYYLRLGKSEEDETFYKCSSLEPLLPLVMETFGIKVKWVEIG